MHISTIGLDLAKTSFRFTGRCGQLEPSCRPALSLDGIEEADELLMAVALHAAAGDPSLQPSSAANNVVVPRRL